MSNCDIILGQCALTGGQSKWIIQGSFVFLFVVFFVHAHVVYCNWREKKKKLINFIHQEMKGLFILSLFLSLSLFFSPFFFFLFLPLPLFFLFFFFFQITSFFQLWKVFFIWGNLPHVNTDNSNIIMPCGHFNLVWMPVEYKRPHGELYHHS